MSGPSSTPISTASRRGDRSAPVTYGQRDGGTARPAEAGQRPVVGQVPTTWREDLAAALPGWVVARLVVATAWLANATLVAVRLDGVEPTATSQGLFAWDATYYADIAQFGYANIGFDAIRFHPLLPLLGFNAVGVLLVANLSGLVAAALVHRLAASVTGDRDLARRAATLVALAPPAFSLVWAYAEGPFLVLAALQLIALRRRWWWAAGAAGVLASLTRPAGLLLALPAAVEAVASLREPGRRAWAGVVGIAGRIAAVAGPVAGIVGYLWWVEEATGEGMLPVRIQDDLRGGYVFPVVRVLQGFGEMVSDPLGDGLHIPFALGMVYLAWVCCRRLPASWAVLATAVVVTSLGAGNLNSIERYAYGSVPMIVALAAVTGGRRWRPAVALSTLGMLGMTVLAWHGEYVP